jgi:hypothetical protein
MKNLLKLTVAVMLATLSLAELAYAQDDYPYYINRAGRKIKVQDLRANNQGDLQVALEGGGTQVVNKADYKFAYIPKPQQVALLEQMFQQGAYDQLLQNVQGVFDRYKYLGWGGLLYYMKGEAELAAGRADTARQTLDLGVRFAREEDLELINMAKAKALMALGRNDELKGILEQLKRAQSPEAAAFSFMATGMILAEQGQNDEAILELLKTVLLFEPKGKLAGIHEEARKKVVELLKEKGDPSYKKFEK